MQNINESYPAMSIQVNIGTLIYDDALRDLNQRLTNLLEWAKRIKVTVSKELLAFEKELADHLLALILKENEKKRLKDHDKSNGGESKDEGNGKEAQSKKNSAEGTENQNPKDIVTHKPGGTTVKDYRNNKGCPMTAADIDAMMTETEKACCDDGENEFSRPAMRITEHQAATCCVEYREAVNMAKCGMLGPFAFWMNKGSTMESIDADILQRGEDFAVALQFIHTNCFPGIDVNALRIYFKPEQTVAFNSKGLLFFNLSYWVSMNQISSDLECVYCWYHTFCHEVAHNKVAKHGEEHNFVLKWLCTLRVEDLFRAWYVKKPFVGDHVETVKTEHVSTPSKIESSSPVSSEKIRRIIPRKESHDRDTGSNLCADSKSTFQAGNHSFCTNSVDASAEGKDAVPVVDDVRTVTGSPNNMDAVDDYVIVSSPAKPAKAKRKKRIVKRIVRGNGKVGPSPGISDGDVHVQFNDPADESGEEKTFDEVKSAVSSAAENIRLVVDAQVESPEPTHSNTESFIA
jgi:hypothetical protein